MGHCKIKYWYLPAILFFALCLAFQLINKPPHKNYDPEYIQYHNAGNFLKSKRITDSNHPGVASTIFQATYLKFRLLISQDDYYKVFVKNSDSIIMHLRFLGIILVCLTILWYSYRIRFVELFDFLLLHIPLFMSFVLIVGAGMVSPRPLLISLILIHLVPVKGRNYKTRIFTDILIITTKITSIPYIILPYLAKKNIKGILTVFGIGIIFLGVTSIFTSGRNLSFIGEFLVHSGGYGTGESFFEFLPFIENIMYLIRRNPQIYLLWIFVFGIFIRFNGKIKPEPRNYLWSLIAADTVFTFFIARHVGRSYYLIPFILFFIPKLNLLMPFIKESVSSSVVFRKYVIVPLLFMILSIGVLLFRDKLIAIDNYKSSEIPEELSALFKKQYPNVLESSEDYDLLFAHWVGRQANGLEIYKYDEDFCKKNN